MAILDSAERRLAACLAQLALTNPFSPERIEIERRALGEEFDPAVAEWNLSPDFSGEPPNVRRLLERGEVVLEKLRRALERGRSASAAERDAYPEMCHFVLYQRHREGFDTVVTSALAGGRVPSVAPLWRAFRDDASRLLNAGRDKPIEESVNAHLFALIFQVRRAFQNIFHWILGVSRPAARLRAEVWQSVFTWDFQRYTNVLFDRMADFTTLVTGPSGTGKELVARAIGLSRFIPFDPREERFTADFAGSFTSLNIASLSPTLIESELFGHKRGSFTGAVSDRVGWLESCPPLGSVFLDEIGELDGSIQVKLLRVLETRRFSRIGETQERVFAGKIIAATNRELAAEMRAGRFREDLYYRLCSDIVRTPSLRARLLDRPSELGHLAHSMIGRFAQEHAAEATDEIVTWITENLGPSYPWPGNVRELEQCVRNLIVRRTYHPVGEDEPREASEVALLERMRACELTAEDLLRYYCTMAYERIGTYEGTARRLGLDRRTVRAKVDPELLA